MGTRSLTEVADGNQVLVTMYRQYDGYPSGHGNELKEFLASGALTNGIGDNHNDFNGMGCLAAAMIRNFKEGSGNVYIYPPGSRDYGEEYIYQVSERHNILMLTVYSGGVTYFGAPSEGEDRPEATKPIYQGPASEFDGDKIEATL